MEEKINKKMSDLSKAVLNLKNKPDIKEILLNLGVASLEIEHNHYLTYNINILSKCEMRIEGKTLIIKH
jgi:hypothetical protein